MLLYCKPFSSVSIVEFEQANVCWSRKNCLFIQNLSSDTADIYKPDKTPTLCGFFGVITLSF